jgi:solute carrier family 31 (copper transporter), member 1
MNMPSNGVSTMSMMMPYLHFTGGDYLFFQSWHPTSPGAIAGACIGLASLAILDRWIAGSRSVLESHWRQRCVILCFVAAIFPNCNRDRGLDLTSRPRTADISEKSGFVVKDGIRAESRPAVPMHPTSAKLTILPFIPKHDVPRGIIHAGQSLLSYILMLAVM